MLEGRDHVTQQCVLADLAMRLQLLGDENIAQTTSGAGGLDLTGVLRDGGLVILEVPEAHSRQLVPLTNLFIGQWFSALIEESMRSPGGRLAHPCTVVFDEFGSAVGRLADFDCRLSTLRCRGVSVLAAVQTMSQIENLYGKGAGAILEGFCSKLFLGGGLADADARYASELSGVCTVESVTVTETNEVGAEEAVALVAHPRADAAAGAAARGGGAAADPRAAGGAGDGVPAGPAAVPGLLDAGLRAARAGCGPAARDGVGRPLGRPGRARRRWGRTGCRCRPRRPGSCSAAASTAAGSNGCSTTWRRSASCTSGCPSRGRRCWSCSSGRREGGTRDAAGNLAYLHWRLVRQVEGVAPDGPGDHGLAG